MTNLNIVFSDDYSDDYVYMLKYVDNTVSCSSLTTEVNKIFYSMYDLLSFIQDNYVLENIGYKMVITRILKERRF